MSPEQKAFPEHLVATMPHVKDFIDEATREGKWTFVRSEKSAFGGEQPQQTERARELAEWTHVLELHKEAPTTHFDELRRVFSERRTPGVRLEIDRPQRRAYVRHLGPVV